MSRPVPVFRRTRLHIFGPDTTTGRGYIRGQGVSGMHSKHFPSCGLTITANTLEDVLAADPTLLEDAFVVPEVYYEPDDAFLPFGTPYLLAPGAGTVIGPREGAAREQAPVGVGALHGMLETLVVLPTEVDPDSPTFRKAGGLEQNRYLNFSSKGYQESLHTWHDADVYDATGQKKAGKPANWPDPDAEWVFRDADEGGRTCLRFGTFTLTERRRVTFESSSDENHKVFLDGPNQGGVIIDFTADEDGYNQGVGHHSMRLEPGTYRVSAWMLTVDSEGGDGNDSMRFTCWSVKTDGSGDRDAFLLRSGTGTGTRVLRQQMSDEIPGMGIGEVIRRLLEECVTVAGGDATYAQLLLDNRTFTDALNTPGNAWTHLKEWVWPLGTSLASALTDMLADCDLDMGPDFSFNAWNDRGDDLSATVKLTPGGDPPTAGMNIVDYGWDSDPAGPNGYLVSTQDGLVLHTPAVAAGVFRRLGQLESGSSGSTARGRSLASKAVDATGEARRYYHGTIAAVAGAVPYVDFDLCDVVNGRGYRNLGLDLEVTAMSWQQGDTTKFALDLGEQ